ncbi:MAG: hypothetical protein BEN18_01665 [Epulopiscium sp. Nuni2H_MBin001]|nr:MAG: hypothetical protein BEN18_01665 [Epulopiscium sp. Nuni2H_MBin001]
MARNIIKAKQIELIDADDRIYSPGRMPIIKSRKVELIDDEERYRRDGSRILKPWTIEELDNKVYVGTEENSQNHIPQPKIEVKPEEQDFKKKKKDPKPPFKRKELPKKEDIEFLYWQAEQHLEAAEDKAESIVEEARKEAVSITKKAEKDMKKYQDDMRKKIRQDKESADLHNAQEKENAQQYVEQLKYEAEQEKQVLLGNMETEVVNLVLDLLGHIISHELADSNRWIGYLVRKILYQQRIIEPFELGVSSKIFSTLTDSDIFELTNIIKGTTLIERPDLPDYACIIGTDNGEIYYDAWNALENVRQDLLLVHQVGDSHD